MSICVYIIYNLSLSSKVEPFYFLITFLEKNMSVPVKKLLASSDAKLKERVFRKTLTEIASKIENGQAWLDHFACMWGESVSTHLPSKYSHLVSIKKQSKFLSEATLQDVVNSFRGEYKFFCACVKWEKGKYWLDEKAGHGCLVAWIAEQGLTRRDTIFLYPSCEAILSAAHGGPGKKNVRDQLEREVNSLLLRGVSAKGIIRFFWQSKRFRDLHLGEKIGD